MTFLSAPVAQTERAMTCFSVTLLGNSEISPEIPIGSEVALLLLQESRSRLCSERLLWTLMWSRNACKQNSKKCRE